MSDFQSPEAGHPRNVRQANVRERATIHVNALQIQLSEMGKSFTRNSGLGQFQLIEIGQHLQVLKTFICYFLIPDSVVFDPKNLQSFQVAEVNEAFVSYTCVFQVKLLEFSKVGNVLQALVINRIVLEANTFKVRQ